MRPNVVPGCNKSAPGSRGVQGNPWLVQYSVFPDCRYWFPWWHSETRRGLIPPCVRITRTIGKISIAKRTPIREGVDLQFTAEFFNRSQLRAIWRSGDLYQRVSRISG